jgi:hypothetical protein
MAKGLRSSIKKNNRTKLRAKVFGPVVDARTERLSQKLLQLAQQARPAKSEMEVDSDKGMSGCEMTLTPSLLGNVNLCADTPSDQAPATAETTQAEGLSFGLAYPIPAFLSDSEGESEGEEKHKGQQEGDPMLYQLLGLSSDIMGFGQHGDLLICFDKLS